MTKPIKRKTGILNSLYAEPQKESFQILVYFHSHFEDPMSVCIMYILNGAYIYIDEYTR